MRALTWQGKRDVRVENVPDPRLREPEDAIIRVTSSGICGSDLHLYEVLTPYMEPGDVLGHEPMGVVEEVGSGVDNLRKGQRVVIPFQTACGHCHLCELGLHSQCETTQVRERNMGAALFGYTKLYGQLPGGQAEYLRVPQARFTHIPVPEDGPDERFVYLSDVLPTAWQAVEYANVPAGGSVTVLGLGPIGTMACRIAKQRGAERVFGVDLVPERLERARRDGVEPFDLRETDDVPAAIRQETHGRGSDAVIDAVGMEAHGSTLSSVGKLAQHMATLLPTGVARTVMNRAGLDRLGALYTAIDCVRRGGTLSLSGVYGGQADPLPMLTLFDKQVQLRMGQANVKHWIEAIMPLVAESSDPLGVENFATHTLPLRQAPHGYDIFQRKSDGAFKVLLQP
ncbi:MULTISPECIES: zinc-dependent alcohol dehydrogenase [Actinopolyspora]|uniref:Threonine dehydrogenase n=2 Tax=Actinomycetes TaxID=1760 RepID=A0A1H0ZFT4_9ACTN|nr:MULTISPECIES: zinc-dependent alcohol dehydrogenase [Actinopolyspora]NHD15814.1 glutathione-dependent formaldehyde dehydrogenase [Actinopolyspora sp. BKK2]NHE74972.1 glutathione-dependent formaldehyde dehydrogenase [Actinopolyspora sp. BKK1]SDQ26290.1 Threonine dehydrogenase [Actinopolyspora saharensis]